MNISKGWVKIDPRIVIGKRIPIAYQYSDHRISDEIFILDQNTGQNINSPFPYRFANSIDHVADENWIIRKKLFKLIQSKVWSVL